MATRVNRKNAPATSPKEVVASEKAQQKNEASADTPKSAGTPKSIGKRIAKNNPKNIVKKPLLGVTLKAKGRKPLKLNPLAKAALHSTKSAESKKKLLKNGVKEKRFRKRKLNQKESEDNPPVLEPIFPLDENVKKQPKKGGRPKKRETQSETTELLDVDAIKVEPEDPTQKDTNNVPPVPKQGKKRGRKPKVQKETIEDVMKDLSFLIKAEDIKTEVDDLSESSKSDIITKPKKNIKKIKLDLLNSNITKKENLENAPVKFDSSAEKIIEMLDLNVATLKKKNPSIRRRHSIEKCPFSQGDTTDTLNIFNHLPRSLSPRAKRKGKAEGTSNRSSPYSTRSDSPARILRNGKQRKLKLGLLDGLDLEVKKRRRLGSEMGSEIGFKLSGYESDSSFSDLSSVHGTESNEALKDETDTKPSISTASNGPIDSLALVDTNSNYNNVTIKTESNILPEKDALLDIMKQAFNEVDLKKSTKFKVGTVVSSRFYGKRSSTPSQGKPETIIKDSLISEPEIREKIADEAPPLIENTQEYCTAVTDVAETVTETTENVDTENNIVDDAVKSTEVITQDTLVNDSEEVKPETTEKAAEEVEPETSDKAEEVEPETTDKAEEVEPETTDKAEEVEPETTDKAEEVEPETTDKAEEEKPETIEKAEEVNIECNSYPEVEQQSEVPVTTESDTKVDDAEAKSMACDNLAVVEDVQSESVDENQLDIEAPILEPEVLPEIGPKEEEKLPEPEEPSEEATEDVKDVEAKDIVNEEEMLQEEESEVVADNVTEPMEEQISEVGEENLNTISTENINAVITENTVEDYNLNLEKAPEDIAEKESILKALGLQRSEVTDEFVKQKTKERPSGSKGENYTGTLKTVIKINRDKKKGSKSSIKSSTLHKIKSKSNTSTEDEQPTLAEENRSNREKEASSSSSWKHGPQSSDTADGSSEHTSDGETTTQDGTIKALVIPEKASSFSIHPGRLCKDECSYCFGKFGLFDTPCHIAQMKSVDRQNKILATETHLTRDSCLCDACYRHVDRKSNTPSYMNKSLKRNSLVAPGPRQNHCHVLGCNRESSNILRRKWIIKMRKSICQVINIDLDNPGLHSIPICDQHYAALEHLMICAMCKRRLARNHVQYLGPETTELNRVLNENGIPLKLNDKPVVLCKLCKCFATIILKNPDERAETSVNFLNEYKKRLLHFNDIVPMDESEAEEPIIVPSRAERIENLKRKKKLIKNPAAVDRTDVEDQEEPAAREERVPSTDTNSQSRSRSESPSDDYNGIDYNTLIPAIAMEIGSDTEGKRDGKSPNMIKKLTDMHREGVEIVKIVKAEKPKGGEASTSKLGFNSSVSVRQLFPGEDDLPLTGNIEFNNVKDKTPEGWEKCCSVIQYDEETKRLWQELQKPYGNQSSFLRHLILLEKYFRNGDLVLSPKASHHSINYSESVHNRLRAYDNIPTSAGNIQPLSMLPFNKMSGKSSSIISSGVTHPALNSSVFTISSIQNPNTPKPVGTTGMSVTTIPINHAKSTPLTISQLNSPPLLPSTATLQPINRAKMAAPPGLISLHPGTSRPVAPLVKVPQPQKIKFPITKNWRPNLIPIDPTKKQGRKTGLVQVISCGKPYHITLEDYKKMCAIKRSFEMKQQRLQEAQPKSIFVTHNSVLKSITPRKGLVISKTATVSAPPKLEPPELVPEGENILDKLDKQVEKLESKLNEKSYIPRIPKSLTVIPQTVTKRTSRPASPVLLITPKNSSGKS
ncbi:uncharacterized protein LOC114328850 isoform X2 [Diabrotica virgifera virgifera]|uniref:Uncharacterized protein n=1 Tax=Diabrotica virgifera virgifera TaxID=50390 RepID=A0ABM5IIK1_DIAVI|nr:uncharacterized protein LOC114328850 isoform X2 [Diabrotica virgifera virgifera]